MEEDFIQQAENLYRSRQLSGPAANYDASMTDPILEYASKLDSNRFYRPNNKLYGNFAESRFLTPYDDPTKDDISEKLATRQPWLSKFAAGFGRVGTKVATEIAKLPGVATGIVAGTVASIADDKSDFMQAAFNNGWIQAINELGETVNEEALPVYVKKAVKEGNLWDNLLSIDFWATDAADGIGYIVSMLAPGMAINKFNLGAKLIGGSKWAKMAKSVDDAATNLTKFGMTPKGANLHLSTLANTVFEAGVEAQSTMQALQDDLDDRLVKGEITQQDYNIEKANISRLGRNVFAANAAILVGPNAIVSKMLWGGARNKAVGSLFDKMKLLKELPKVEKIKMLQLWGDDFAKAGLREGLWEEGMQSTTEQYFKENKDSNLFDLVGDLPHAYADMFSTLDGQKAIFLGAILGGGMQAFTGHKQRGQERATTNRLLKLWGNAANSLDQLFGEDVYEKTKTGKIRIKDGKPVLDNKAFVDKLRGLDGLETVSTLFDIANQQGDTETIEQLRDALIAHFVKPFVLNEELGLDVLKQHLDYSEALIPIKERVDKGKGTFVTEVLNKAKEMQKAYETFEEFSPYFVKLDNAKATEQQKVSFFNNLANQYLNFKSRQEFLKKKLAQYESSKSDLLEGYGLSRNISKEELEKERKSKRRLDFVQKKIDAIKTSLEEITKVIEEDIWDSKKVNQVFNEKLKEEEELKEKIAKQQEVQKELDEIKNIGKLEDLENRKSDNPAIQQAITQRTEELRLRQKEEVAKKKNQNREFNSKQQAEKASNKFKAENYNVGETVSFANNTRQGEIIEIKNTSMTVREANGKTHTLSYNPTKVTGPIEKPTIDPDQYDSKAKYDAKLIVVDDNGNKLPFVSDAAYEFQNQPRDKRGEQVGFSINVDVANIDPNWAEAIEAYRNRDFSNLDLLYDYLPINAIFGDNITTPIETKPRTKESQKVFDETARPLRKIIIDELKEGTDISSITSEIIGQKGGEILVEPEFVENLIHQLWEFQGEIDLVTAENIYVVNERGTLVNYKGDVAPVGLSKGVANDKGKYYIIITKANGSKARLRLNDAFITENQRSLIYDILMETYDDYVAKKYPKLTSVSSDLQEKIKTLLVKELEFFKSNNMFYKDLTVKDIIDILIYDETGKKRKAPKTDMRFMITEDGSIFVAGKAFKKEELTREEFIKRLDTKRRHIIDKKDKKKGPNALGLNNKKYLHFIIQERILNTNAVIDKPTFGKDTTMYISKDKVKIDGKPSQKVPHPVKVEPKPKPKGTRVTDYKNAPDPYDPISAAFGEPTTLEGLEEEKETFSKNQETINKRVQVTVKGQPAAPKPSPSPKIVLSEQDQLRAIDEISNGEGIIQEHLRLNGRYMSITKDYIVVTWSDEDIQVETDVAVIQKAFDILESTIKTGMYHTTFSKKEAEASLRNRFAGKQTPPVVKAEVKTPVISDEEVAKMIKSIIVQYKQYTREIAQILQKGKIKNTPNKQILDNLLSLLATKNISREQVEKKCNV